MQQPAVYQREVTVSGENGLHIRPIHQIVKTAQRYKCATRIQKGAHSVDATSMLDLMTLGAEHGTLLILECSGEGAEECVEALAQLFNAGFPEDAAG
jgi:phosphotransferase system HPr (HPr) family protein